MSNFWSLKKFEQWLLTREFLKQYFTEKQNGYYFAKWSLTGGCRLREVVAIGES